MQKSRMEPDSPTFIPTATSADRYRIPEITKIGNLGVSRPYGMLRDSKDVLDDEQSWTAEGLAVHLVPEHTAREELISCTDSRESSD